MIESLRSELRANNIEIEPDFFANKIIRKDSQWARFHRWEYNNKEYIAASFGDWARNLKCEYKSWKNEDLNGSSAKFDEWREKARLEEKDEREKLQDEARDEAQKEFSEATTCDSHPYTRKKGLENIQRYGVRLGADGALRAPLRDVEGILWSYQSIFPDGTKRFKKFGRKKGLYHQLVQTGDGPPGEVYIAEGFATAASVAMALDNIKRASIYSYAILCAFDSGNLLHVAQNIRAKYPDARIIICADNDQYGKDGTLREPKDNAGIVKGVEAAQAVKGICIYPTFARAQYGKSDFNDLMLEQELNIVTEQILKQINQKPPEPPAITPPEPAPVNTPEKKKYIHMLPDSDGKRALSTLKNMQFIVNHVGATVRYNVIAKKEEILIPGQNYSLDNYDNCCVSYFYDICARLQMPLGNIVQYLGAIADSHQYNPVKTWVESKPWDGVSRLKDFYKTVVIDDENDQHMKEVFILKWMLSAIAAAYLPEGVSAHGVLVFQGSQGVGKTQWFRSLVPGNLKLTSDGQTLVPNDKDSVYQIIQKWLVELGELDATFKKADVAQLKSFVGKQFDILRIPYAVKPVTLPRRTVFFASVNQEEFLADTTGNRRFWVIKTKSLNWQHGLDMQQIWAEVAGLFNARETDDVWHLNAGEMRQLARSQAIFEVKHHVEERISKLPWDNKNFERTWMTSTEILDALGIRSPNKGDKDAVGRAMKKYGAKIKIVDGYRQWHLPLKKLLI